MLTCGQLAANHVLPPPPHSFLPCSCFWVSLPCNGSRCGGAGHCACGFRSPSAGRSPPCSAWMFAWSAPRCQRGLVSLLQITCLSSTFWRFAVWSRSVSSPSMRSEHGRSRPLSRACRKRFSWIASGAARSPVPTRRWRKGCSAAVPCCFSPRPRPATARRFASFIARISPPLAIFLARQAGSRRSSCSLSRSAIQRLRRHGSAMRPCFRIFGPFLRASRSGAISPLASRSPMREEKIARSSPGKPHPPSSACLRPWRARPDRTSPRGPSRRPSMPLRRTPRLKLQPLSFIGSLIRGARQRRRRIPLRGACRTANMALLRFVTGIENT
jgi:hypothetical protein